MSLFVRRAVAADIDALLPLCRRFHGESPVHSRLAFDEATVRLLLERTFVDDSWLAQVAFDGEAIVGMALHYCMSSWFSIEREVGDLTLYVVPEARGSRAAYKMMSEVIKWADAKRASRVQQGVTTGINDAQAERFFAWFGFERTGIVMTLAPAPTA